MPKPGVPRRIRPGRLLIAAPDRLDDACFSVPAVRALAKVYSVDRVAVLCGDSQRALWRTVSDIDPVVHRDGAGVRAIRAVIESQETKFSAALAWERSNASRALQKSGIQPRYGPADERLRGDLTEPLAIDRKVGPIEHRVRDFLLLAEALGARPFQAENFKPVDLGITAEAGTLAVIPDSDFGASHQWPVARWVDTLEKATAGRDVRISVVCRDGGQLAGDLAAALGDRAVLERPGSLADEIYLFARHRIVAAADGTATHLAAHVGATCLVVFGPNEPAWKRPLGKRHRILRRHVECSPCLLAGCPLDHRCMEELEAGEVADALADLLDG